jgi:hypothetical protein
MSEPQQHSDALVIEAQTAAVSKLALGVTEFTEEFRRSEALKEEFRQRDRKIYLILLSLLIIVCAVAGGGLLRLNTIANSNHKNGAIIKDCVDPTGVCYQRNAEQTRNTVLLIVDANHNGKIDSQEILDAINGMNKNGAIK